MRHNTRQYGAPCATLSRLALWYICIMKKVMDTVKHVIEDTSALFGEGYNAATNLLGETLQHFYDVKDLTKEKAAGLTNDVIALAPIIEQTGYRTKELNISVSIPPRITIHFEKFAEVSPERIEDILLEHQDKKLLKVIVQTLLAADSFQQKLTMGSFAFNEINISLSVPPEVQVKFLNSATL